MQTSVTKELFITICLGLLVGALTTAFLKALQFVAIQHMTWNNELWPIHVFFLPIVLLVLHLLKKRTLYFPTRFSELSSWTSESCFAWSVWMTPFKFLGTLLSHLVGASIGRESVAVLMSAGMVRIFQLPWNFWGPIAMGTGFAAVLGNPWIGVIFVMELFRTSVKQKVFLLISSYFAFLLMQTLHVPHLIPPIEIQSDMGFFKTLSFILALAVSVGFLMRAYKWAYLRLSLFFRDSSIFIRLGCALILAALLATPQLRLFQSLGLSQIEDLEKLKIGFQIPLLKLMLTLFSVTLGFWGGEFIPLVFTGLHYGASLADLLGYQSIVGAYFGCYLFFAAATRLKWTSFFLILGVMGLSWCFWLLLLINMTVGFSGDESLYRSYE